MAKTNERTIVRIHQLTNTEACAKRRSFPWGNWLNTGETKAHMERAGVIITSAVKAADALFDAGHLEHDEAAEKEKEILETLSNDLAAGFESLDYKSARQKEAQLHDAYRWCERYAKSYAERPHSKSLIKPDVRDVILSDRLMVEGVSPTGIDLYKSPVDADGKEVAEFMLEAYKLHASKPKLNQETVYESLEPYTLMKYLESRVTPGHTAYLKASVMYLRKANDKSGEHPNFDSDFYNTIGGRNIVTIEEVYHAPAAGEEKVESDLDIVYKKIVNAYVEGLDETECTDDDCSKCELFNACKFTSAPEAKTKLPSLRSLGALRLTPAQQQIIGFRKGNLRVLAGPGSGKTMCSTVRVISMMTEGVAPEDFLLITFTDAAARETRERIEAYNEDLAGIDISEMKIMTFNSFGDYLIGLRFEDLGFARKPSVIDDVERSLIISNLLCQHGEINGLDYRNFETEMKNCKGALAMVSLIFSIVKKGENGVSYGVTDYEKVYRELGGNKRFLTGGTEGDRLETVKAIVRLYDLYDEKLRENCLIEYADQETMPFELIRQDPMFLASLGIRHLLVDEYQDSNNNNARLCKELVHMRGLESSCFVGDPSQAIYGFRGGVSENLLDLAAKLDAPVVDIPLMENFRSDATICNFANSLIEKVDRRMPKIVPMRPATYPVIVKPFHYKEDEIEYVIDTIKKHISGEIEPKVNPEDIAVVCATKTELREMADALGTAGIDTVLLAPEILKENSRVRAAIACVRAIDDENDKKDLIDYAFARFVSTYGIDASESRIDILIRCKNEFNELLAKVSEEFVAARNMGRAEKKEFLIDLLKVIDEHEDEVFEAFIATLDRKRNFAEISDYVNSFEQFGDKVAYRRLRGFSAVSLTTAHSSKGLEWPIVFNMISKYDDCEDSHKNRATIAERTNLFYVSATRAKERVYITGRYIAYGKRGAYVYNTYLQSAMEIVGQVFDRATIEEQKRLIDLERKQNKAANKSAGPTAEDKIREKMQAAKKKAVCTKTA